MKTVLTSISVISHHRGRAGMLIQLPLPPQSQGRINVVVPANGTLSWRRMMLPMIMAQRQHKHNSYYNCCCYYGTFAVNATGQCFRLGFPTHTTTTTSTTTTTTTPNTPRMTSMIPLLQKQQNRRNMGTWPKVRPRRVRVLTMDVTGTLVSFRGTLEEHYLGAAEQCGVQCDVLYDDDVNNESSDNNDNNDNLTNDGSNKENNSLNMTVPKKPTIARAFHQAYQEVSQLHPCFGGRDLSAKDWWKLCVIRSFELTGIEMTSMQQEMVFQRIYSIFGSRAAYEIFGDALPFLRWAQRNGIVCGVLSNADERYGDSILPMLGLTHDQLQFQCYSKDLCLEKPDARFYLAAMRQAEPWLKSQDLKVDPLLPSHVLHIGNDYNKDFEGARRAGMHAILLNRYDEVERAEEWQRRGAIVKQDLMDLIDFLGRSDCELG